MPTPHISAAPDEIASTCLLPGDPLRAEYIAQTFLTDAHKVTDVRNMLGFTGTHNDTSITVMGTGMGVPSASIYAKELITEYGVQELIRVGSCGALAPEAQLRDVVIAMSASTDSKVNRIRFGDHDLAATADYGLLRNAVDAAERRGVPVRVGSVFTSDLFYTPEPEIFDKVEALGMIGVEMEAAGIYGVAAEFGAKALAVMTVSDHIRREEHLSPEDRQSSFDDMIALVLDAVT